ncbi:putative eka-like protein [Erysiphe necator]|uniref:Putative eka-like protein n=1 Tax=Uncinula necator TaxID=52586 RepID=A0A0B1P808_UNCNE|nr:putative eka-like protein [Erysiphe necator]
MRQRRERAWHARLMICTTAISSIESSLANFKDEIEIEEVAAFQAYLQLAIANFAAVDTSPTPPKIPSHSRPSKGSRHGLGNDKIAANKVAIAIPRNIPSLESSLRKTQGTSSHQRSLKK